MRSDPGFIPRPFRAYHARDIDQIPQLQHLSPDQRTSLKVVSSVLPFRLNNYLVDELIDWHDIPRDPIFQLTVPQPAMLSPQEFNQIFRLIKSEAPRKELLANVRQIQMNMNPHPAGQMELNIPQKDGRSVQGMQHKYRETILFFPSQAQTCHAYCTYCFRWAQFVGIDSLKFASKEGDALVDYLKKHEEISDVLFTGGDPLIMKTSLLRRYLQPLLDADLEHLTTIRLGTKAPAYWPYRFLSDPDADDLLRLFEEIVASGKHLAIMAHYSHPRELSTPAAQKALRRIAATGAVIRSQAPLIRHVNDDADVWTNLWQTQVKLGIIPYYLFVARDTGPRHYFKVPLMRAFELFSQAYRQVSGLGRTVRGPSMSTTPGKILVEGITEIHNQKVFALKFIQARNPMWVNRLFFAKFDPHASWLDELVPAFGEEHFFFQESMGCVLVPDLQPPLL